METIQEKYKRLRPLLADGDIILFHGVKALARIIQWCDRSYFNHTGIIVEKHGALFIVDANGNGVQADRLSYRVNGYKHYADFTILRPLVNKAALDRAMMHLLKKSDSKTIKYDFDNGAKELFNRRFRPIFKIRDDGPLEAICSSNVSSYAIELEMMNEPFNKLRIVFPEDYIRYINIKNTKIIN